jgi:hypothetical protein
MLVHMNILTYIDIKSIVTFSFAETQSDYTKPLQCVTILLFTARMGRLGAAQTGTAHEGGNGCGTGDV